MPMSNLLEEHLGNSDAEKVIAHAKQLIRLSNIYQTIVPAYLGKTSQLVHYKSGKVVIHAANHATATKLRQISPTIINGLFLNGLECTEIQIKVQAIEIKKLSPEQPKKRLSHAAAMEIEQLCNKLQESELRKTLEKLLTYADAR